MICECSQYSDNPKEVQAYFREHRMSPQTSLKDIEMFRVIQDTTKEIMQGYRGTGRTTDVCRDVAGLVLGMDADSVFGEGIVPTICVGVMSSREQENVRGILFNMVEYADSRVGSIIFAGGWEILFVNVAESGVINAVLGKNVVTLYLHHTVTEYMIREAVNEALEYTDTCETVAFIKHNVNNIKARIISRIGIIEGDK